LVYICFILVDVSLLRLVAEALGQEYVESDVSSDSEDFIDIALSGTCPSISELVTMQLDQDQCEYNTWSVLVNYVFIELRFNIELH